MRKQIAQLVHSLLAEEEIALANRLYFLIEARKMMQAWALLEQVLPKYWREKKGVLCTLSPDTVYRPTYYLNEPYEFIRHARFMIELMGNHLEGILEYLLNLHGNVALGGLIDALSKTKPSEVTSPLFEFNNIYVCAKHMKADPFLQTRLDRRTFSTRDAIYCLIVMRHLSMKLFDLLLESGKSLAEEWKQIDPEWLRWDRDKPVSPARGVISLREEYF